MQGTRIKMQETRNKMQETRDKRQETRYNIKFKPYILHLDSCILILVSCILILAYFIILGCAKSKDQASYIPSKPAQELYTKSQQELSNGDYKKAFYDYQKAVEIDKRIANIGHLSSIVYDWAISQSEPEDIPLLIAQKQVFLEPERSEFRKQLISVSVDREKGVIYAIGFGIINADKPLPTQRQFLTSKAAISDSQIWVARIAQWAKNGIECPFDISTSITGYEKLKENWIGDVICVVKLKAPIDCLN
jgi:hypothetical protein